MIEWIIIIILASLVAFGVHLFRNMFRTLNNIQARLGDLYVITEDYDELVKKLNASETYYGDSTIESFVKMSNELNDNLKGVRGLQQELTGDLDDKKENEA